MIKTSRSVPNHILEKMVESRWHELSKEAETAPPTEWPRILRETEELLLIHPAYNTWGVGYISAIFYGRFHAAADIVMNAQSILESAGFQVNFEIPVVTRWKESEDDF